MKGKAKRSLEQRFNALVKEWRAATEQSSDPVAILAHPAYHEIISLGGRVLPFIFRELQQNGGLWFSALRTLTGEDPVPRDAQSMREVREAWLEYGTRKGYL